MTNQSGLGYNGGMKKQLRAYLAKIGKKGGSAKTKEKADASRRNGLLGGRPRKVLVKG